jgi:HPt (histidine-containing phosphotransfer) domain-containing protein
MPPEKTEIELPMIRAEALERVGEDEAFLEELLSLYDEEFESNTKALTEAIAKSNFAEIRERGHSIKGASANLSLPGLRAAAQAMEFAGAESRIEDARTAMEKLQMEFDRLKKFRSGQ